MPFITLRNSETSGGHDTFVASTSPTKNYYKNHMLIVSGMRFRSALSFHLSVPHDATVLAANLDLYQYPGYTTPAATTKFKVALISSKWDGSHATYQKRPSYTTPSATTVIPASRVSVRGSEPITRIDITTLIQAIASGTKSWYGLYMWLPGGGGYVRFVSSDGDRHYVRPVLRIQYSRAPNAPTVCTPTGSAIVASKTPTLAFNFKDADGEDKLSDCDVRIYPNTGTVLASSGTVPGNGGQYTVPASVGLIYNTWYKWKVKVSDHHGIWSGFSKLHKFKILALPEVVITYPTDVSSAVWDTDTALGSAAVTLTNVEASGSGASAYLRLTSGNTSGTAIINTGDKFETPIQELQYTLADTVTSSADVNMYIQTAAGSTLLTHASTGSCNLDVSTFAKKQLKTVCVLTRVSSAMTSPKLDKLKVNALGLSESMRPKFEWTFTPNASTGNAIQRQFSMALEKWGVTTQGYSLVYKSDTQVNASAYFDYPNVHGNVLALETRYRLRMHFWDANTTRTSIANSPCYVTKEIEFWISHDDSVNPCTSISASQGLSNLPGIVIDWVRQNDPNGFYLFRKRPDQEDYELVADIEDGADREYLDYECPGGSAVYAVQPYIYGSNGVAGALLATATCVPSLLGWWLIYQEDDSYNVPLFYGDEEVLDARHLIGRTTHYAFGRVAPVTVSQDNHSLAGTLSAELRAYNGLDAMEYYKRFQRIIHLKQPLRLIDNKGHSWIIDITGEEFTAGISRKKDKYNVSFEFVQVGGYDVGVTN